jgi:hypothetical protein
MGGDLWSDKSLTPLEYPAVASYTASNAGARLPRTPPGQDGRLGSAYPQPFYDYNANLLYPRSPSFNAEEASGSSVPRTVGIPSR